MKRRRKSAARNHRKEEGAFVTGMIIGNPDNDLVFKEEVKLYNPETINRSLEWIIRLRGIASPSLTAAGFSKGILDVMARPWWTI